MFHLFLMLETCHCDWYSIGIAGKADPFFLLLM
jgi:hypothetical protein